MRISITIILFLFILTGCNNQVDQNNAGYITMLGSDTLAIEKFKKTPTGISAQVLLRSPQTNLTSYELTTNNSGGIEELKYYTHTPETGFSEIGILTRSYSKDGDSLHIVTGIDTDDIKTSTIAYQEGVLPFIDMVHWPFELAFNNASKSGADSTDQILLTGTRPSVFVVAKIDSDSMTIRHPFRGVMGSTVDDNGNLITLDASQTTRKLKVKRSHNIDINAIASGFVEADKKGKSFGSLSGAEEKEFNIDGALINISYGTPSRRNRDLFGGIVAFGERWRTGANRATHFSTSKDLMFGELLVLAGDYTLYSIPEKEGGTLIINKQTGQNGTTYNQDRDLGRVEIQVRSKADNTEVFTINITDNGLLELIWGNTVYFTSFKVQ